MPLSPPSIRLRTNPTTNAVPGGKQLQKMNRARRMALKAAGKLDEMDVSHTQRKNHKRQLAIQAAAEIVAKDLKRGFVGDGAGTSLGGEFQDGAVAWPLFQNFRTYSLNTTPFPSRMLAFLLRFFFRSVRLLRLLPISGSLPLRPLYLFTPRTLRDAASA
jgi:hypothetical protein